MKRIAISAWFAALALASGAPNAATLYYASGTGQLYQIDSATGNAAPAGFYDGMNFSDLASSPVPNQVYAIDATSSTGCLRLVSAAGQASRLMGCAGIDIKGIGYDANHNILYGTDDSSLYTVDQLTGAATRVGSFGGQTTMQALAYDAGMDTLYAADVDTGALYTIDTSTGAATQVGPTGSTHLINDIYIDPTTGQMFGIGGELTGQTPLPTFYAIDKATGAVTVVRSGLPSPGSGVAAPLPPPATPQFASVVFSGKPSSIPCTNTSAALGPGVTVSWNLPPSISYRFAMTIYSTVVGPNASTFVIEQDTRSFDSPTGSDGFFGMSASYPFPISLPYRAEYSVTPDVSGAGTSLFSFDCVDGVGTNFRISNAPPFGPSPVAGVWWDPHQPGSGYGLDYRDGVLIVQAYSYLADGSPQWYLSSGTIIYNAFHATLDKYIDGQCISCAYKAPRSVGNDGDITIVFTSPTTADVTLPGGRKTQIQRYFGVATNVAPASSVAPVAGVWWDPQQPGSGYGLDYQDGVLIVQAYSYLAGGAAQWYLAAGQLNANVFHGTLDKYTGGQCITCDYSAPTLVGNDGDIDITFTSPTTANVTLPGGRQIQIQRYFQP